MFLRKLNLAKKSACFFDKKSSLSLIKYLNNRQFISLPVHRCFSLKREDKKSDLGEETSEVEKEVEETEEQKKRKLELEEKRKMMMEGYTEEELNEINEKGEEKVFMEITELNRRKVFRAKKLSIFLNLPLSVLIMLLIDWGFGDVTDLNPNIKPLYYMLMTLDYMFFLNAVTVLVGLRNIVLMAKYLPKGKVVEFTKLNILCKPYKIKEKVEQLKRVSGNSRLTPFLSLKNKITNNMYSMNGIGDWKDRKLYNALFPQFRNVKPKNKRDKKGFLGL